MITQGKYEIIHAAMELFKEDVRNGTADAKYNARMTFQEYAEIWFKEFAPELELRTVQNYRERMPRILDAMGHLPLDEIKQLHIRQFLNNLAEKGSRAYYGRIERGEHSATLDICRKISDALWISISELFADLP